MKLFSCVLITIFGVHTASSMSPIDQLQNAIQKADPVLAQEALAQGVDPNVRFRTRMYPLEFVAFKATQLGTSPEDIRNLTQIATLLLDRDADVNVIVDPQGDTLLHELADWFDTSKPIQALQLVKLFLDKGANPNATNKSGENPLSIADQAHPSFIKLLLNYGADPAVKDRKGRTLLEKTRAITTSNRYTSIQRKAAEQIVELLESYQALAQVMPKDYRQQQVLRQAIEQGFPTLVQKILRSGIPLERDELKFSLDLAKQKYRETQDPSYQEIGRMLLQNLGLTGQETRVSKTGIEQSLDILPNEMIEYIRTFMQ